MFQILLNGAEPCDVGTTQLSSPVCQRGCQQDPLGICCVVVHAHNVPKQCKLAQLDYNSEVRVAGSASKLVMVGLYGFTDD